MMSDSSRKNYAENVALSADEKQVVILDQTLLPNACKYISLSGREELYEAIHQLRVRGAPAIGIFAGYALYVLAQQLEYQDREDFLQKLRACKEYLNSARPTAVNLNWALNRVYEKAAGDTGCSVEESIAQMGAEAKAIQAEDIQMCTAISHFGLELLKDGDGILTHCNAGPLATSQYGTALGPILLGHEQGMQFHVFADETRPLLQGARLTSYELETAGVDVTLICDNMASMVMKNGWVQACLVGCDRVAANGDTANKIGTSGVAILAKHYGVPFYVLGPTSTIDMACPTGEQIEIELRDPEEVKSLFYAKPMALAQTKCYNPSFDVTDHSLITVIITEKGICYPPYEDSLAKLFK